MQYMVVGSDGQEYGPVSMDVLQQWVRENRITPTSTLKDFHTGQPLPASSIPGLFAPSAAPGVQTNWSQPPTPAVYPRQGGMQSGRDPGVSALWGSIIRSGLALLFFFLLHGIGIIFGAYGLYYAIQAKAHGNRYGTIAIVISSVTLALIAIGWFMRMSGPTTGY